MPIAQQLREMIDEWTYIKQKASAQQRKQSLDLREPTDGRKSLPAIHLIPDINN
jgi:hypothetical protein